MIAQQGPVFISAPDGLAMRDGVPPGEGVLIHPSPQDLRRNYPTYGITPAKLYNLIVNADSGALGDWRELWEDMVLRDSHLRTVFEKRMRGVSGVPWTIAPSEDRNANPDRAKEVADYLGDMLRECEGFENCLRYLRTAVGPGIAVAEKEFRGTRLAAVHVVPDRRLGVLQYQGAEIRVKQRAEDAEGIVVTDDKFITCMPYAYDARPTAFSLQRSVCGPWIIKNYGVKDWANAVERFGLPFVKGTYRGDAWEKQRSTLQTAIKNMAGSGYGLFAEGVDIELLTHTVTTFPHEALIDWCNSEMSKAFLGQTLTTEPGDRGARSLGEVHADVEASLIYSDALTEAETLAPMLKQLTAIQFGPEAPVPIFKRELQEVADFTAIDAQIRAAQAAGIKRVSLAWMLDRLQIEAPANVDDVLELSSPAPAPMYPPNLGNFGV